MRRYPARPVHNSLLSSGGTDYGVYHYNDILIYTCGDADGDGSVNIGDVVYIGNYVFKSKECAANPPVGCPPDPYGAGDVDCDGSMNIGDGVYLGNAVFRPGSPTPCKGFP